MRQQNKKQNHNTKVKIIPLGGLEQIGMNMTAIECEDNIIVDWHFPVMICWELTYASLM